MEDIIKEKKERKGSTLMFDDMTMVDSTQETTLATLEYIFLRIYNT